MRFVGRREQLATLTRCWDRARQQARGELVLVRGRRQVGKSRLVEEFLRQVDTPAVYYTATHHTSDRERQRFVDALATSSLPSATRIASGLVPRSWEAALELAGEDSDPARPSVIVVDEFPYLLDSDAALESTVQAVWDRTLSRLPVLVVLVGSDLSMMELLSTYGHPLYGRPTRELLVRPFSVAETAELLGLQGAQAIDAHLTVGGFPLVARSWQRGQTREAFLQEALADPTSPLVVVGERMLAAEMPADAQPRLVLDAIGAGETTYAAISARSGLPKTALARPLQVLTQSKQLVAAETPLSATVSTRDRRYRVDDAYLRFWLRFVAASLGLVERGRGALAYANVEKGWPAYRGRAVEPLVRSALERLLPDPRLGTTELLGGYWTRSNDVEVDLVGVDAVKTPRNVAAVGTIKWRPVRPTDRNALEAVATRVPGVSEHTKRVVVCPSLPSGRDTWDAIFTAEDVVSAWS